MSISDQKAGLSREPRILVLGYGNPGRQDDGLGPAVAAGIDGLGWPNITAYDNYQLNIEDAVDVAENDVVWFVDAAKAGQAPYAVHDVAPAATIEFTNYSWSTAGLKPDDGGTLKIERKHQIVQEKG